MTPQYIWNMTIDHHKVGEMFIVCGVLYAVDNVSDRQSRIRFAFDLYKSKLIDVSLQFNNPFRKTTMISYNHRSKVCLWTMRHLGSKLGQRFMVFVSCFADFWEMLQSAHFCNTRLRNKYTFWKVKHPLGNVESFT